MITAAPFSVGFQSPKEIALGLAACGLCGSAPPECISLLGAHQCSQSNCTSSEGELSIPSPQSMFPKSIWGLEDAVLCQIFVPLSANGKSSWI